MSPDRLPTRLGRDVIYESRWVSLYSDQVALPTGRVLEAYHLLDFGPGAVAVLVENQAGQILMEQVARYPTGTTTWELPAGRIEPGEQILRAAQREVLEETGYQTSAHRQMYTYHPLNGISGTTNTIVHCRVGEKTGQMDANEVQATRWFDPDELREMVRRGEITDGFALVGLLLHLSQGLGQDRDRD